MLRLTTLLPLAVSLVLVFAFPYGGASEGRELVPEDLEIDDAASELSLSSSETRGLRDDQLIFKDFCMQARDIINMELKSRALDVASKVASEFFDRSVTSGIDDAILASKLRENSERRGFHPVRAIITMAMEVLGRLVSGRGVNYSDKFWSRINQLACNEIKSGILVLVNLTLSEAKRELSQAAQDPRLRDAISATKLADLGCKTTSRLYRAGLEC